MEKMGRATFKFGFMKLTIGFAEKLKISAGSLRTLIFTSLK
jgi:hypothetical protein